MTNKITFSGFCSILFIFSFFKVNNCLRIECNFENDTLTTWNTPLYTCSSMKLYEIENKILQSANGTHEPGYSNSLVEHIRLTFGVEDLTYIPENVTVLFPNLTVLTFGFTKIREISSNDLMQFPNIKIFASTYNPILSLPGDLFKYNPKLEDIRFYATTPNKNESISEIGRNLFGNLDQLTTVIFLRHYCIASEFALNRSEVLDLNNRLPVMCPSSTDPTEIPTSTSTESEPTEESTQQSTSPEISTSTQATTTSGQHSKYQILSFLYSCCIFSTYFYYLFFSEIKN